MKAASLSPALALVASIASLPSKTPPDSAKPRAVYADVGNAAGLHFQYRRSPTPSKYLIETMGGGVAIFDYDGDGWPDVFFTNGAALKNPQPEGEPPDKSSPDYWNRLFRNNRDGTFTDVTEKAGVKGRGYGMGVAAGDYDNDGFADFFVTNYGDCILYHNNGDGTFSDVTDRAGIKTAGWNMSAGFLDYNNDGNLDLFISRYLQWNFSIGAMVCGVNLPGGRAYCHPNEFKAISNYLFRNKGDGTFTDVSEESHIKGSEGYGLGISFGDFNDDGFLDIYVANDAFPQFLFKNNGDGTFTEVAALAGVAYTEDGNTFSGMGTDFADLDNDGFPDLLTTALPYEYFTLFHNNGDSTFTYSSVTSNLAQISRSFGGWGIHVFDYDNDSSNEVFVATSHVMDNIEVTQPHLSYLQKPLLLKYQGGRFVDISSTAGDPFHQQWVGRGAAFGDLDNDGDTDIVISDYNGSAHLLRNQGGNQNRWIELELQGTTSNRDGIGARLKLTSGSGKVQYRTVSSAGSYASSNDRRVVFGLGEKETIGQIAIRWPSGVEQVIDNPKPNQIMRVSEPSPGTRTPAGKLPGSIPANAEGKQGLSALSGRLLPVQLSGKQGPQQLLDSGLALLRQGKMEEAAEAFKAALRLRPEFVDARYALGVALSRLGREHFPAAVDEFLEVLRSRPDHIDARVDLGWILAQEGDSYAAAAQLEAAIRYDSRNPDLYVLLGKAQCDSKRYPEAQESFRRALELNPQMWAAHYGIGVALVGEKRNLDAAEHFRVALNLNPNDPFSHYELGEIALEREDHAQAELHLKAAVRLRPEMAPAYVGLAKLRRRQGKPVEAESFYRTALQHQSNLVDALYGLAALLKAEGKTREAKDYFERVKAIQQSRGAMTRANVLNADGIKYTNDGRPEQALVAFREALTADPRFFMAAYNQGVVLHRLGRKQEAIEMFKKAIRLRPDFVMGHYALGLMLKTEGDPAAEEELRKARLLDQYVAQPLGRENPKTLEGEK